MAVLLKNDNDPQEIPQRNSSLQLYRQAGAVLVVQIVQYPWLVSAILAGGYGEGSTPKILRTPLGGIMKNSDSGSGKHEILMSLLVFEVPGPESHSQNGFDGFSVRWVSHGGTLSGPPPSPDILH